MSPAPASPAERVAQAKVRRQKQILAVGSVVLLALVGYQLPKLLGGGSRSSAPGVPSIAQTSPGTISVGTLPDTDRVVVQPGSGQLISFGLFKSKDPFVQQLSAGVAAAPAPAASTPPSVVPAATTSQPGTPPLRTAPNGGLAPVTTTTPLTPPTTVAFPSTTPSSLPSVPAVTSTVPVVPPSPATSTPVVTVPAVTEPATTTPVTTTPASTPASVAISTNGACQVVAKDGTFPAQEDIFRVVSIAKDGKSAKIAVVGGAYDSGATAATLKLGSTLTLVNTADGTRYELALKTGCDTATQPVAVGTTTPTSTVAPPAPTPTVTTPIVTDALDATTPTG